MMSYDSGEPILGQDYIKTLLVRLSNQVDRFRSDQPEARTFAESRADWNRCLPQLEASAVEQCDNEIFPAFLAYQETVESYLIVRGLTDTVACRLQGGPEPAEPAEIPGLHAAESHLTRVCRQLLGQLDRESSLHFLQYMQARKALIDTGRSLYWRCGVELAESLLGCAD